MAKLWGYYWKCISNNIDKELNRVDKDKIRNKKIKSNKKRLINWQIEKKLK